MEKKDKINPDEKLKNTTAEVIDDLSNVIKNTSRKFLDACVERSVEIFSEVFDSYAEKTKEKIKKKGSKDEE